MNHDVEKFIEQNDSILDDIDQLISKADYELEPNLFNEFVTTLKDAKIHSETVPLKNKIVLDDDELEEQIEAIVPYECRAKYVSIMHTSAIQNIVEFTYISQEEMNQYAVDKIIPCLNNFLVDASNELIGATVRGNAWCRDEEHLKFPISFKVQNHMSEYNTEYTYHIVFSSDTDMYASVDKLLGSDDDYESIFEKAENIADTEYDEILDDYGEGFLFIIRCPKNIDIDTLSGETLMNYVEQTWDIFEV